MHYLGVFNLTDNGFKLLISVEEAGFVVNLVPCIRLMLTCQ